MNCVKCGGPAVNYLKFHKHLWWPFGPSFPICFDCSMKFVLEAMQYKLEGVD